MIKWMILSLLTLPLFGSDEAIQKLIEGNDRYVKGHVAPSAPGQTPFAVILACSDSRVAPEIIFDQGLGDLFVVRVAGNVAGDLGMESIQYATHVLGASVVMVLGHENCGAITAVKTGKTADISAIASLVEPNIKGIQNLEAAIKANVRGVVANLKDLVDVDVIGGYYDFDTGKVEILTDKNAP